MYRPKNFIHEETFRIRAYEINERKTASIPALVRLMQETAMQHVLKLKLSVWDLEPQNLAWVLIRKTMRTIRYPLLGERIRIRTHPSGFEKIFTYRDFLIFDEQDQIIASASTCWLLMNTRERKMTRIPPVFLEFNDLLPDPTTFLPRPDTRIPAVEKVDYSQHFTVQRHELDFNLHLNNTFYVQWMLEALPETVLAQASMQKMDLIYRTECYWRDEVVAETQQMDSNLFYHRLRRLTDDQELASGRSTWKVQ